MTYGDARQSWDKGQFSETINYCRAACMAQANYEMYHALDQVTMRHG